MKIDYVIISSDDNPMYKDFYEIVAKRWFDLGYKTYYINITDVDDEIINQWGTIKKIKKIDGIPTGFQSQVVRLFSHNLIDGNLLTSDIDMLPISKTYFDNISSEFKEDKILICSGQPYGDTPFYPMCYVVSNNKIMTKCLGIDNYNFEEYCKMLQTNYGLNWNTDENFLYDQCEKNQELLVIKNRTFSNRIDRSKWDYNLELIQNDYYVDSHLLRPFNEHKKEINKLINLITNE